MKKYLNIQIAKLSLFALSSPLVCGLSGQILQVVRAPNGAQYIIQQPQQQILLQQQMQPGGVQAPVIQQVHPIRQVGTPRPFTILIKSKIGYVKCFSR